MHQTANNAVILATAGYDHKIRFWDPPTGECLKSLCFSDSQVILDKRKGDKARHEE